MHIVIVTPAPPGTRHGNRSTALRWARHLRALGHVVSVEVNWDGRPRDLMIALHARRSHASIKRWTERQPGAPLALTLTGTDLYGDIHSDPAARESLSLADRLVVLQDLGVEQLPPPMRDRCRVIHQSVHAPRRHAPPRDSFLVTVIGHLREVKDPFRAAFAMAHLPPDSRIRVVQIGGAMNPAYAQQAQDLMQQQPRYRWLGERSHADTMRWLGRSHAMVISSHMEGGAHVVSEAIACGVPVIASDIAGNIGLLGPHYPGYYALGDDRMLATRLRRAETDCAYLASLETAVKARRPLTVAATEKAALGELLAELAQHGPSR